MEVPHFSYSKFGKPLSTIINLPKKQPSLNLTAYQNLVNTRKRIEFIAQLNQQIMKEKENQKSLQLLFLLQKYMKKMLDDIQKRYQYVINGTENLHDVYLNKELGSLKTMEKGINSKLHDLKTSLITEQTNNNLHLEEQFKIELKSSYLNEKYLRNTILGYVNEIKKNGLNSN